MSSQRDGWKVGAVVSGWRIEGVLGRGGQGVVYAAAAEDGRHAAIKTLSAHASERLRERFRREGEGQARVEHPNVLRVHSAGEHLGRPYLVSELAEGGDLGERLKQRGRLGLDEARAIVSAIARAVHHVHLQGLLHRDIKPANVLFDERGTPKLGDFGLVRIQDADSLTATGQALGTVAYMAPELVDDAKTADARADVYALGALLFRCVSGETVFKCDSRMAALYTILERPAPLLRSVAPHAPAALEAVCARALEKDPAARFATADAFADALDAALADVPAGGSSRWPLAAAAVLLVSVALAGAALELTRGDATPPPKAPAAPAPPAQPAPDPGWALKPGSTLRYAMRWSEHSPKGNEGVSVGTLSLAFSASDVAGCVHVEATFAFDVVSPSENIHLTDVLKRTHDRVAVAGDLDLETGALSVTSHPKEVIASVLDPRAPPRLGGELSADPRAIFNNWVQGAFRGLPFRNALELLFARPRAGEFEWTRRGDEEFSFQRTEGQVLYALVWMHSGFEVDGLRAINARRRVSGGVPVTMSFLQEFDTLPIRNADGAIRPVHVDVSLELELLEPRRR